jgi:hypothetical protein
MFQEHKIIAEYLSGGYMYARTAPLHPKASSIGLYASHRIIAENSLGRYLDSNEYVHHKNRDKKDNTLSNLEVLDVSEHARLHSIERQVKNIECSCKYCGKYFELAPYVFRLRKNRNKEGEIFCSRSCDAKYQFAVARQERG